MKSVSPGSFRFIFLLLLLLSSGCASVGGRPEIIKDRAWRSILSLRPISSVGPVLGRGTVLVEPSCVTVNELGEIFISDRGANAILKLSATMEMVSGEGGTGKALGGFNRPMGLAADAALNLYVADSGNRRIQILDRNLRYVDTVDSYFDENDRPVKFGLPEDVAIDRENSFWIADNDRVIRLDPFYGLQFEMSYDAPGDFTVGRVSSVAVSKSDLVAVADAGNRQIIVATIYGNLVSRFEGGFVTSLAWDDHGAVWATDPNAGRLSAYDSNGNVLFVFAENNPGYKPLWVTFDPSGRMLVVDGARRTLTVYEIVRGIGE